MNKQMNRIDNLIADNSYRDWLNRLTEYEADRIYCRHNFEHFLAVARIATILNEDEALGYDRELIYAAALLHDLGRVSEYENGTPHHEASCRLAQELLDNGEWSEEETDIITQAIASHRSADSPEEDKSFSALLYRADKLSRNCIFCDAPGCKIPLEKRNMKLML